MKNSEKYTRNYFMPPEVCRDWARKEYVDRSPVWCSVDLRDGNQALVVPMSLDEKISFFKLLMEVGFKEIEVGFPAASETEYAFIRALIEENLIPDDVTIQVLTQAREHIIKKTFASLRGVKKAIVHLYNPTSLAQREQVFRKSQEQIIQIATTGAQLMQQYAAETEGQFLFEYSPESFTGTEMEFALRICNSVLDVWQPRQEKPVIINLPVTVALSMPHVYASQIEYMSKHLNYRDNVILSLHPHNDRGCAVADAELGLLAGGQRIEGTLFGNGERTGNVDLVTLALNMFSHGVDPGLDFSQLPKIEAVYEECTGMKVNERQPYGGKLVFAAFSGSHQDAIAKGIKWRESRTEDFWSVPYLPIDPCDIGRTYDSDVIRINSQSGKGGIGYLLERYYGIHLPPKMCEGFGYEVKHVSDYLHKEIKAREVYDIFQREYVNLEEPIKLLRCRFTHGQADQYTVKVEVEYYGEEMCLHGEGNGRLDAVNSALQHELHVYYTDLLYTEHALTIGSKSQAAAYVGIKALDGNVFWGVGIHNDIVTASIQALISAVNKKIKAQQEKEQ